MEKEMVLNSDIMAAVEWYLKLREKELSLEEIRFIIQEMSLYVPVPPKHPQ